MGGAAAAWLAGVRSATFIVMITLTVLVARFRYRWRFTLSVLDDLPTLAATVGVATLITAGGFTVVLTTDDNFPDLRILGGIIAGLVILTFMVIGRLVALSGTRVLRRRRVGVARGVIVGTDPTAIRLGDAIEHDAELGVSLIGYLGHADAPDRQQLLGPVESLPDIVEEWDIDVVLISLDPSNDPTLVNSIRSLTSARCEIFVVPRLYELHDGAVTSDLVRGLPLVPLRRLAFRSPSWRAKRIIDILVATIGLVVAFPAMLCVALAVRWETGPGVIFKQKRIGRNGQAFTLYKFCSLKPVEGEGDVQWSIDGDPRLGRVGAFIRATSLDELPQLVNVIRGHMSLVGPRPERPYFVDEFSATIPGYSYRHRMPVGLTGLAVVNGMRGDTDIGGRADFDNLYAESWSLWLDVKIILRTAGRVVPHQRGKPDDTGSPR